MWWLTFRTSCRSFSPSHSSFDSQNQLYFLLCRGGTSSLSSASWVKCITACVWISTPSFHAMYITHLLKCECLIQTHIHRCPLSLYIQHELVLRDFNLAAHLLEESTSLRWSLYLKDRLVDTINVMNHMHLFDKFQQLVECMWYDGSGVIRGYSTVPWVIIVIALCYTPSTCRSDIGKEMAHPKI